MNEGDKGYVWERVFFGFSTKRIRPQRGYVDWHRAYHHICLNQTEQYKGQWNPATPNTTASRTLFEAVKKELPQHLANVLRLYCSLGSELDFFHRVDGFFTFEEAEDLVYVCFDLTTAKSNNKRTYPHILRIKPTRDPIELAKIIADRLKSRLMMLSGSLVLPRKRHS